MRFSFEGQGCFPTGKHYPGIAHLLRVLAAGLVDEFDAQTALSDLPLISIDTETTGRDAANDRIVELACVVCEHGQIVDQRSWLFNPGCPIPKEASDVHGITDDQVQDKPTFAALLPEILQALVGRVPIAYNAEFDQGFILEELKRAARGPADLPPAARPKIQWVDPLTWARELHKDAKSKALGAMAELLSVKLETAHRATDDAAAAALILSKFFADTRVPKTYGAFMQEQQRLARVQKDERQYWQVR
jgi:DNA polymerase III subunit epsilon